MSKHHPVSPYERAAFHRQGSAGALSFNAMPMLANVQALAPVPTGLGEQMHDPAAPQDAPGLLMYNPALDGKKTPRGIDAPAGVLLVVMNTLTSFWESVSVLSEKDRVNGVYLLPASWYAIFAILLPGATPADADYVRKRIRFVY